MSIRVEGEPRETARWGGRKILEFLRSAVATELQEAG